MNQQDETKTLTAAVILSTVVVIVGGWKYLKTVREERAKREKIEAWKQENLACIANSRDRVIDALSNPDVPLPEAMALWREENKFLRIVQNQPKY